MTLQLMSKIDTEFREIKGYDGYYEINRNGFIRSVRREVTAGYGVREAGKQLLNPFKRADGRYYVNLYTDNRRKREPVHRLVAEAFLEGYQKGRTIYFKDGNEGNYHVDNLSFDKKYKRDRLIDFKLVIKHLETGIIQECENAYVASKIIGCSPSNFYMREQPQYILKDYLVKVMPK